MESIDPPQVFWTCSLPNHLADGVCFSGEFLIDISLNAILIPLSRMFTSSMAEEAKALQEDIAAVQEKIDDPVLCEKIKRYIEAPKDIQNLYKLDAGKYLSFL